MTAPPRRFPLPLARVGASAVQRPAPPARSAATGAAFPGVGLDTEAVRSRMVQRLRAEGARCEPVLAALGSVPRHLFVDSALVAQSYEDTSLPIGLGQTISKPSVIARMLGLLFEGRDAARSGSLGRVLEIGTGCGYQAAVLVRIAQHVISIERLRPLHERARNNLAAVERSNLRLVYGDGQHGHAPNAPYDAIICAAGGDEVPQPWLDQLAIGGRLVAPIQQAGREGQVLLVVDRSEHGWSRRCHEAVRFVPLRSGTA